MVGLSLGIIQLVKLLKRLQLIWYWFDGGQGETTACWGQRIHWALLQPAIVKKEAPQWEQEGETLAGRRKTCHVCRRHQCPGVQQHSGPEVQEKTMSLSSSLLALAKTVDKKVDNNQQVHQTAHGNTKWIEPGVSATAAASGFKPKPLLSRPFFPIGEHSAPLDRWPEQMIDKCYPKARTCHHSRHLPQLDNQQHWSWQWVEPRPPYGIQLLEEFRRWKANQWWSKWSCSAEPYRYAGLMTCRTGKQWRRCALKYSRRLRAAYITWSLLTYPLSPIAITIL